MRRRMLIAIAAFVPALLHGAGGCVMRPAPHQPGYLGPVEYYDLGHVATENRGESYNRLNFAGHSMLFVPGRIELDGTDLWARNYTRVVLRRGRGGELLMTVDGQRVPTNVRLEPA